MLRSLSGRPFFILCILFLSERSLGGYQCSVHSAVVDCRRSTHDDVYMLQSNHGSPLPMCGAPPPHHLTSTARRLSLSCVHLLTWLTVMTSPRPEERAADLKGLDCLTVLNCVWATFHLRSVQLHAA